MAIDAILGDQAAPEDRAALRVTLRLDRPMPEQYMDFMGEVAGGTLGRSFRNRTRTVSAMIAEVLPFTAWLALSSLALISVGVPSP